jgi:hypothetical protein
MDALYHDYHFTDFEASISVHVEYTDRLSRVHSAYFLD